METRPKLTLHKPTPATTPGGNAASNASGSSISPRAASAPTSASVASSPTTTLMPGVALPPVVMSVVAAALPSYWLIEGGHATGPHTPEKLREKAQLAAIARTSLVAAEGAADWIPIEADTALAAMVFPAGATSLVLAAARPVQTTDQALVQPPSVDELLVQNLARQRAAEGELLRELPTRPNRRLHDFLWLAGLINAGCLVLALVLPMNPVVLVSLISGSAMGTAGLAWVIFVVMDRY